MKFFMSEMYVGSSSLLSRCLARHFLAGRTAEADTYLSTPSNVLNSSSGLKRLTLFMNTSTSVSLSFNSEKLRSFRVALIALIFLVIAISLSALTTIFPSSSSIPSVLWGGGD